jgi:hypothetical protein
VKKEAYAKLIKEANERADWLSRHSGLGSRAKKDEACFRALADALEKTLTALGYVLETYGSLAIEEAERITEESAE